ncbi:uncharacterized protein LOC133516585 isoform X1 [Cydia pomonella]|uniref:uncharacterized protein LOC133516585 isoform X1 n=2 Tax=Cydia pomonella TaxID=82600 RepID=UPI002ADDF38E|nr:uncharacterized protein LOC133516585 isoform X1 [Cydia pomonella]XP_061705573.1 uncharacterized protein LOC133516585 isoform X1 [Cydia pomonella]
MHRQNLVASEKDSCASSVVVGHSDVIMDLPELEPLEASVPPRPHKPARYCSNLASRGFFRGPLRICKLLAFLILLPSLFIFIPLYMRYRVFQAQMYPMSMTDMRLIDSKISPTWCQRQVVKSNTTFNAFVMPGPPELSEELVPVSMTRELELEDDMKEYWGFYLLKGSTVTVSACVNHPGASLIMIKGYKHLKDCAYIGDDSSEEVDELLEANKLGQLSDTILAEKILKLLDKDLPLTGTNLPGKIKEDLQLSNTNLLGKILELLEAKKSGQLSDKILVERMQELTSNGKTNHPGTMKRHKAGVSFLDRDRHTNNVTSSESMPTADVTDHDPKELREILESLHAQRQAAKTESFKNYQPPGNLISLKTAKQRHRDTNVDKEERKWISFNDLNANTSDQSSKIANATTERKTSKIVETTPELSTMPLLNTTPAKKEVVEVTTTEKYTKDKNLLLTATENVITTNEPYVRLDNTIEVKSGKKNKDGANIDVEPTADTQEPSSREVFENILHQLQSLGPRGTRILKRLHKTMGVDYTQQGHVANIMGAVKGSDEELDRLRKVLVEAIDEEKTRPQRRQKRHEAREEARAKRDLMLGQIEIQKDFNEDDEARNNAAEEDVQPDGYADRHEVINETTPFDMSNSEYWSSFSSSEERLLQCDGLILNLPMTPHRSCMKNADDAQSATAAKANALTYRVPANGYYFFVFNSENERQKNFIRAKFDLQKTRYEVAQTALRECRNSTQRCDLLLDIFSSQKVVLEVPLRNNDSLWNEQFVIVSECEPRTSIYLACVVAVPLLIMIFAFQ